MNKQELYNNFINYFYGKVDAYMFESANSNLYSVLHGKESIDVYNRKLREFTRVLYLLKQRVERTIIKLEKSLDLMKREGYSLSNKFEKENLLKENRTVYINIKNFMQEFNSVTGVSLGEVHDVIIYLEATKNDQIV